MDSPVVVSCRGSQINIAPHVPSRTGFRDDLRATFAIAKRIHCVSDAIKFEAGQYGLNPAKSVVIRPAVNPDFFYPADKKIDDGRFRVVTTGNLVWLKGHEYALMSIKQLVDQGINAQFDIIGEGPERQRILFTIHDLELQGHVRLHGGLNQKGVREILQRADAFLLSSLSEGISNAALEAMACGLPVVSTDCGGMREAIENGVHGFIVPLRDPNEMASKLAALARDAKLRELMGEAARARVLGNFRLDSQVGSFRDLLKTAMNGVQD